MDPNTFGGGIVEPLSNEQEQAALDRTPAPQTISETMAAAATVGYVQKYVGTHQRWCPALRVLRRWSIFACVLLGALITLNAVGWISAKSVFVEAVREGVHAELKATIRVEVQEVLKDMGFIHAQLEEHVR